ncbi:glycosyltransferase family 1 protein [Nocardioides anomalus]|uniref:Glycosyltransferase family 1 protein n=1 Tax=Nocardioides anomalus TaxID=2712223 RepID=A0A6G6WCC9_9ACTN|nr:glycosyltransferase [Nocardioides anomalus]QIG43001.1 glycosyltransferase family 1 protein [Nocardioides anomalus]
MRVLFSSTSGPGHVVPMLQLARAFREAGHQVRWATATQAAPLVTAAGIEAVAAGVHGAEEQALRSAVLTGAQERPGPERAAYVFPRMFGAALAPPMAADLLAVARDWGPDLLVHEQAELAAPLVGAVLGAPVVTHSFGTAIPPPLLEEAGRRLAPVWREHGLDVPPHAGCFDAGYLDICPPAVQTTSTEHINHVLPLRPVTAAPAPRPAEPLVYVTLGTVHHSVELLQELARGVAALPVRVLVALGPGLDAGSLGEQPDHVTVAGWVDQSDVLDRTSAVVSHGGSGTFLGALARGIPQLCVPQGADQFRNAEGGVRAGAALVLGPGAVSADAVRVAVERLLADRDLRAAAQRVAAEIAAMPAPDDVARVLAGRHP